MLVYHATRKANIQSILEKGLLKDRSYHGKVFFVTDFHDAWTTAEKWIVTDGAVLEIEISAEELLESEQDNTHDRDFGTCSARSINHDIDPAHIKTVYHFSYSYKQNEAEILGITLT